MANNDLELSLKISANSKEAVEAIDLLDEELKGLSGASEDATESLTDAEKAAKRLGDESDNAARKVDALAKQEGGIKKLGESFKKLGGDLKNLGANISVVTAPLAVLAGLGLKNIFDLGELKDADQSFKDFRKSILFVKDNLLEMSIEIAQLLLPVLKDITTFVGNAISYFRLLDDSTKELIIKFGAVALAIGPMLLGFGLFLEIMGTLAIVTSTFGTAIAAITAFFSPLAIAIGGTVALLVGMVGLFTKLQEAGESVGDALISTFKLVGSFFLKYLVGSVLDGINVMLKGVSYIAGIFSKAIAKDVDYAIGSIKDVSSKIDTIFDEEKGKVDKVLEKVGSSAGDAFTFGLSTSIVDAKNSISGIFDGMDSSKLSFKNAEAIKGLDDLKNKANEVSEAIKGSLENNISGSISSIIEGTKSAGQAFADMTRDILRDIQRILVRQQVVNAIAGTKAFASGGFVSGAGSSTSDSIPARLSNGEFVVRASSVKKLGVGFMNRINNIGSRGFGAKKLNHFADGGEVSAMSGGGAVSVEIINTGTQKDSSRAEFNPETMVVSVFMEDLNKNGAMSRGLSTAFGIKRSGN